MKTLYCFIIAVASLAFSLTLSANPNVPDQVKSAFESSHETHINPDWYPYPDNNKTAENVYPSFNSPLVLDSPAYYEARFKSNDKKVRKLYDQDGVCVLVSNVYPEGEIPAQIDEYMNKRAYNYWNLISYEQVQFLGKTEDFYHKVTLKTREKTHALYFSVDHYLMDIKKWHNYMQSNNRKSHVLIRSAPQGERKPISITNLPHAITSELEKKNDKIEITGLWEVEPVHLPENRDGLEYFDVPLENVYEVIYNKGNKEYKTTYNASGNHLETTQIIEWNKLPKYVKRTASESLYKYWVFETEIEKYETEDGNTIYRLHANEFGNPQLLLVTKE